MRVSPERQWEGELIVLNAMDSRATLALALASI